MLMLLLASLTMLTQDGTMLLEQFKTQNSLIKSLKFNPLRSDDQNMVLTTAQMQTDENNSVFVAAGHYYFILHYKASCAFSVWMNSIIYIEQCIINNTIKQFLKKILVTSFFTNIFHLIKMTLSYYFLKEIDQSYLKITFAVTFYYTIYKAATDKWAEH